MADFQLLHPLGTGQKVVENHITPFLDQTQYSNAIRMKFKDKEELINYLNHLIEEEKFSKALDVIQEQKLEGEDDIPLLYLQSKIYQQIQDFGKAINTLQKIIKIDPDQKEAKNYISLINEILRYKNSDIYASPNTTHDPWLE